MQTNKIKWDLLELPDWRARFFIECYMESLSVFTPHFHQAKMMGVIDLAEEVISNITLFEENDKGKGYLISSLRELEIALKNDKTSNTIFSDLVFSFKPFQKKFHLKSFQNH